MIMQLLNILLVLDSNVFHVTVYLVHCVLQFLFFSFLLLCLVLPLLPLLLLSLSLLCFYGHLLSEIKFD